ncbi:MAG: hypothetical protein WKF73_01825 [Nocardioidaceae bacterium]
MVEDLLHLGVEDRRRVRVSWQLSVEDVSDGRAYVGHRRSLAPPVEHEPVVEVFEQVLGCPEVLERLALALTSAVSLSSSTTGSGLVSRSKIASSSSVMSEVTEVINHGSPRNRA